MFNFKKISNCISVLLLTSLLFTGCQTKEEKELAKNKEIVKETVLKEGLDAGTVKFTELFQQVENPTEEQRKDFKKIIDEVLIEPSKQLPDDKLKQVSNLDKVKIEGVKFKETKGDYCGIEIKFTNTSSEKLSYVKFIIELKDKNGNIIDSEWTNATDIPGNSQKIIIKNVKEKDVQECDVHVDEAVYR